LNPLNARSETRHESIAWNSSALLGALDTAYRRIESEAYRNCWIHVRARDEALEECRKLMARAEAGEHLPLLGIPFGVKDNIDVAGMPTTAAYPAFSYLPQRSARSVERLMAAGAICLGKTNLDQFATGLSGARSPYGSCASIADARYVSGGSSSGSAVAVAAGHVVFALGTDTGGSGRIPAGFNDVVGIKPTVGLV
jgi:allophanate hydrolase